MTGAAPARWLRAPHTGLAIQHLLRQMKVGWISQVGIGASQPTACKPLLQPEPRLGPATFDLSGRSKRRDRPITALWTSPCPPLARWQSSVVMRWGATTAVSVGAKLSLQVREPFSCDSNHAFGSGPDFPI
jgi:hypothetical protein